MAESSAHAPGNLINSDDSGGIRQRARMGEGKGPVGASNFGVGPLPGHAVAHNHGGHMPHDGVHLGDHERAGPPALHMGDGNMHATAHSHHGPHHHNHDHHHLLDHDEVRPHHVDGHKGHKGKKR
jgi:hypothetical protein